MVVTEALLSDLDESTLRRLTGGSAQADYELDLSGLDQAHALASIERMIERQRFREDPREVVIRLDPATATSGETLFQPVGRALLASLKKGHISACRPLPITEGAGFYIEMPGKGDARDDVGEEA